MLPSMSQRRQSSKKETAIGGSPKSTNTKTVRTTEGVFTPPSAKRMTRTKSSKNLLWINRTQNLIVVIFITMIISLGLFYRQYMQYFDSYNSLRGGDEERSIWVSQNSQPFNENNAAIKAKHLIMVAGHSVTVSGHLKDAGSDEKDWFLLSYQKGQGLPQAIHAHIAAGIEEARKDPESLLIFSGGETRSVSGPQTEAQAYYHVADAMNLWPSGKRASVRARTTTEEFATDSFENLIFSIARFREITGAYPEKITVVSFSFKQRRFETLHAPALRWPADRFVYVGVNPPASTGFDLARSTMGELKNAAAPFEKDPYGCHSKVLQEKRKGRNPFHRTPPYALSCPEMKDLLGFCGPELIPLNEVPWGNGF